MEAVSQTMVGCSPDTEPHLICSTVQTKHASVRVGGSVDNQMCYGCCKCFVVLAS